MAEDSLTERTPAFNQSSLSSRIAFQLSERIANLELASSLLAKSRALISVALPSAMAECSQAERQYYLAVITELLEGASEQVDDVLEALHVAKAK